MDRTTYSTNGNQYAIEADGSYAALDSDAPVGGGFSGTRAVILDGTNETFEQVTTDPDEGIEPVTSRMGNLVSFGWQMGDFLEDTKNGCTPQGDVLVLDGMSDSPDTHTDTFVLQLSYDDARLSLAEFDGSPLRPSPNATWTATGK